jgi:anti-sigma regulatory factor (Ser/Thr protein kinase)
MPEDAPLASFSIPSDDAEVLPAAERALSVVRDAGFLGGEAARLKVALVELLRNAMEHGNRFDPDRRVTVTVRQEAGGDRLAVTVADEGPGLAPERLDQRLEDVAFDSRRGRGLGMVHRILGGYPAIEARGSAVTIRFGRERFG